MKKIEKFALNFLPYLWLILFVAIPLCILFKISFSEPIIGRPPYGDIVSWIDSKTLQLKFSLVNFSSIFEDELYFYTYFISLKIAFLSALLCLFLGYPLAYSIATATQKWRIILLMLVMLPFWTSFLIRVYAWIALLSPVGIINNFMMSFGFIDEPLPLSGNMPAVIIGITYCYLPFMILPIYASLQRLDPVLLEAAYDLGAKPLRTFMRVTLPLSYGGILSGFMLVFIPAVGEFVIPELLGGTETLTIGRIIWGEFFHNRDWPISAAIAVALMILIALPLLIAQRLQKKIRR